LLVEQEYLSGLPLSGVQIGTDVKDPSRFGRGAVVQTSKSIGVAPTVYLSPTRGPPVVLLILSPAQ
jgi:hypothetical protein